MQPGATIQQTQLVLDASDGSILLFCQAPVACVDNVALHNTNSHMKTYPIMTLLILIMCAASMLMLQTLTEAWHEASTKSPIRRGQLTLMCLGVADLTSTLVPCCIPHLTITS